MYDWTPDHVSTLQARFHAGLSAGMIGEELGITRCAVLGKLHRLGLHDADRPEALRQKLPPSTTPRHRKRRMAQLDRPVQWDGIAKAEEIASYYAKKHKPKVRRNLPLSKRPRPTRMPEPNTIPSTSVTLLARTWTQCAYPVGSATGLAMLVCGAEIEPGRPYCTGHRFIAYGAKNHGTPAAGTYFRAAYLGAR